ncbi:UDP-glucosyltransferase 2-like [Bombyx mori]|uniref:UDP-glucosyltransferase 2-like n=1 Tax=Bombyx mori TaxID=7091 RepID=UPI002ED35679
MVFLNTYEFLDFSRSVPNSVVYTGGMHLQEPKPLPEVNLRSYIENATNGVVYMSLGSKCESSDLPKETLQYTGHPNVKAFITHAGLRSTDEAIAAGVPLIGLPLLVDQFTNAHNYVLHDIGVQLDITTLY